MKNKKMLILLVLTLLILGGVLFVIAKNANKKNEDSDVQNVEKNVEENDASSKEIVGGVDVVGLPTKFRILYPKDEGCLQYNKDKNNEYSCDLNNDGEKEVMSLVYDHTDENTGLDYVNFMYNGKSIFNFSCTIARVYVADLKGDGNMCIILKVFGQSDCKYYVKSYDSDEFQNVDSAKDNYTTYSGDFYYDGNGKFYVSSYVMSNAFEQKVGFEYYEYEGNKIVIKKVDVNDVIGKKCIVSNDEFIRFTEIDLSNEAVSYDNSKEVEAGSEVEIIGYTTKMNLKSNQIKDGLLEQPVAFKVRLKDGKEGYIFSSVGTLQP